MFSFDHEEESRYQVWLGQNENFEDLVDPTWEPDMGNLNSLTFGDLSPEWVVKFKKVISDYRTVFQPTPDKVELFKDGDHEPLHLPLTSKIYTKP